MLQSAKLKGIEDRKRAVIFDMDMQSLEFAQLVFGLALVQYFLTILPFLDFVIIMYILCHTYMLEVCDLLFYSDYRELQLRDYINLRRDFEL